MEGPAAPPVRLCLRLRRLLLQLSFGAGCIDLVVDKHAACPLGALPQAGPALDQVLEAIGLLAGRWRMRHHDLLIGSLAQGAANVMVAHAQAQAAPRTRVAVAAWADSHGRHLVTANDASERLLLVIVCFSVRPAACAAVLGRRFFSAAVGSCSCCCRYGRGWAGIGLPNATERPQSWGRKST